MSNNVTMEMPGECQHILLQNVNVLTICFHLDNLDGSLTDLKCNMLTHLSNSR